MSKSVVKPRKKVTVKEVVAELRGFPRALKLKLVCDLQTRHEILSDARAVRVGGVIAVSYHRQALEGLVSRLERMTKPDMLALLVHLGFISEVTAMELPVLRVDEIAIHAADDVLGGPL